jgi:molybdate transport system ATP-binding protein
MGSRRRLRIRASDVSFVRTRPLDSTILICLPARIQSVSSQNGDDAQVNIVAALGAEGGGARIVGRITRKSQEALALTPGTSIFAQIKSVALVASPAGGG